MAACIWGARNWASGCSWFEFLTWSSQWPVNSMPTATCMLNELQLCGWFVTFIMLANWLNSWHVTDNSLINITFDRDAGVRVKSTFG